MANACSQAVLGLARTSFARVREVVRLLLDPMAVMLIIAAVVYFLLGETRDAVVLALALLPVLGVDVLLEARSRAALEKLARAAAPSADVVRDRQVVSVPLEDVVPGDLLVLREGHVIAADGVVRWVANLAIDESSLTGESEPQPKREWPSTPDEAPPDARFFAGSQVVAGHGFGLVTATGAATQYGGIAALVAQSASSASPLQQKAGLLVRLLGVVAVIVAIALFGLSLARGEPWTRALLSAVSLAMAAIPEEFPIVLTLFLSAGAWRLASRGMLVRRLASVETLGSTTVICTDKTGTLTRGEFQMTRHLDLAPAVSEQDVLEASVLACERHPTDAMERAIGAYGGCYLGRHSCGAEPVLNGSREPGPPTFASVRTTTGSEATVQRTGACRRPDRAPDPAEAACLQRTRGQRSGRRLMRAKGACIKELPASLSPKKTAAFESALPRRGASPFGADLPSWQGQFQGQSRGRRGGAQVAMSFILRIPVAVRWPRG